MDRSSLLSNYVFATSLCYNEKVVQPKPIRAIGSFIWNKAAFSDIIREIGTKKPPGLQLVGILLQYVAHDSDRLSRTPPTVPIMDTVLLCE